MVYGLSVIGGGGITSVVAGSAPSEGDGGVVLARVSAFDPINGISIVLYENGKENEPTGTRFTFLPRVGV